MKKFIAMLLVMTMLVSVSACGSAGGTSSGAAGESSGEKNGQKTDVLIDLPTSGQNVVQTAVPLIAGEQLGIWKDLGLNVTRTHYVSGPPQLEANPSGDWQIGWIGAPAAVTGVLTYNMNVIALSGYDFSNKAFCRADSPLAKAQEGPISETLGTADDWKGLTILVGKGTVLDADMMLMLDKLGLTEDDVDVVNSDLDKAYQAFTSGSADVIFVSGTYTTMLENNPDYVCCHTMGGMDAAMAGNIIAEAGWLKKNEQVVVDYLEGALEVLMWMNDEKNQEKGAEWFAQVMKDEFGTETPIEDALASEKMTKFHDLEFYENLCKVQDNGLTGMQNEFGKFFDIQVAIGNRDAADKEKVVAAVDCSYLAKAIEQYKSNHGTK